jgi:riboflavin synthase
MFTGIVEDVGSIRSVTVRNRSSVLEIETGLSDIKISDSICISGICLTVVQITAAVFMVEVSPETLSKTTLRGIKPRRRVNLERALTVGGRLGGHFVSGHIDQIGTVRKKTPRGKFNILEIAYPPELERYIVPKGSIAIDGVSLTVVDNRKGMFTISLIPYTLQHTTIGDLRIGDSVNLEVDILAKYVEKSFATRNIS